MELVALLIKVAGLVATITVGANAFSYSRFRRQNLAKFRSPIDESKEVLADFNSIGKKALSSPPIAIRITVESFWFMWLS